MKDIAVIIQARSGSERVKNKMLRPFAGSSLLSIAIDKVMSTGIDRSDFYIATADDDIRYIAELNGVNVFKRSKESAVEPVTLQRALEWHDKLDYRRFVIINACNPLLSVSTINDFINTFTESNKKGMFGVVKRRTFFYDNDWSLLSSFAGTPEHLVVLETKMVVPTFEAGHSLYAGTMEDISAGIYMGTFKQKDDPYMYEIPESEFIDIDWPFQFEMAEAVYRARSMRQ